MSDDAELTALVARYRENRLLASDDPVGAVDMLSEELDRLRTELAAENARGFAMSAELDVLRAELASARRQTAVVQDNLARALDDSGGRTARSYYERSEQRRETAEKEEDQQRKLKDEMEWRMNLAERRGDAATTRADTAEQALSWFSLAVAKAAGCDGIVTGEQIIERVATERAARETGERERDGAMVAARHTHEASVAVLAANARLRALEEVACEIMREWNENPNGCPVCGVADGEHESDERCARLDRALTPDAAGSDGGKGGDGG